jgi:DNA repair protein RecO (recombination protein O)
LAIEKAEGIVLRVRPQGETSKLVHLYSLQRGRLALIAKGARLPKSKFGGALDVCNRIAVVFYTKETRELNYLREAEILERFPRVQADIGRLAVAEQGFEILLQLAMAGEPNARLYQLVLDLLRGLNEAESGLRNMGRSFLLHFLESSGFRPNLDRCSVCGRSTVGDRATFEIDRGSYVCAECPPAGKVSFPALGRTVEWARWLQRVPPSKAGVPAPQIVGQELDRWLWLHLSYHVEGADKLVTFRYAGRLALREGELPENGDRNGKEARD